MILLMKMSLLPLMKITLTEVQVEHIRLAAEETFHYFGELKSF